MYFLWIKPRSFRRATSVPYHWTIFPAPGWFYFYLKSVLSKYISLLFLQYIFFCPFTWTMCVFLKWVSYCQQIIWSLFFKIHFICIFLFGEFILFPFKPLLLRTQSCQLVCSLFLPLFCILFLSLVCLSISCVLGLGNLHGKGLILLYLGESICMLSWLLSFFSNIRHLVLFLHD